MSSIGYNLALWKKEELMQLSVWLMMLYNIVTSGIHSLHTCELDAEMVFDGIPHSILLQKAINVIPDKWW